MNKLKYIAAVLIAVAGLGSTAQAVTTLGDATYAARYTLPSSTHLLGTVIPGILGSGQAARDAAMTNTLIGMAVGAQAHIPPPNGPLYSRAFNTFSPLPAATTTGSVIASGLGSGSGTSVSIDLNLTGTFTYLVVAYDGPNSGVAVWDIAGLTGTITFAAYGRPEVVGGLDTGNLLNGATALQYRITSWTLLNPTGPPVGVPDGGATVMLLGAALGALGMARRFLMS